jgi:hypothetical protein
MSEDKGIEELPSEPSIEDNITIKQYLKSNWLSYLLVLFMIYYFVTVLTGDAKISKHGVATVGEIIFASVMILGNLFILFILCKTILSVAKKQKKNKQQ